MTAHSPMRQVTCKPKGKTMQISEFTVVSVSKNMKKAMIIFKHNGKSLTRHAVNKNGIWVHEKFDEDTKKRIEFFEFTTERRKKQDEEDIEFSNFLAHEEDEFVAELFEATTNG